MDKTLLGSLSGRMADKTNSAHIAFDPVWNDVAEDYTQDVPIYPLQISALKDIIEKGTNILDVGCGPAKQAPSLSGHIKTYVGLDMSPTMLSLARESCAGAAAPCLLIQGNATKLPFCPNSFDWAIMLNNTIGVVGSWNERSLALTEMIRTSSCGVIVEFLQDESVREVESKLFRDRFGTLRTHRSARFTKGYFLQIAGELECNVQFRYVRKSTHFSHYITAMISKA